MAVLSDNDRRAVWADVMREFSQREYSIALDKPTLRAVVNAIDDLLNSSAASINTTINNAGGSSLTAKQKAWLVSEVIRQRYNVEV